VLLMKRLWRSRVLLTLLGAAPLAAQGTPAPAVAGRFTNAGVARANLAVDSVFVSKTLAADTIEIGDFAGYLIARLGVPPFSDSLNFVVTADSARVRISGRLMDFPVEARAELGPIFTFLDSTSVFSVDISMPQHSDRLMLFRLERATIRGIPIPDMLLVPALAEYAQRYPVLAAGGRELLVEMPPGATAKLVPNGVAIYLPVKP
jgi:hypothetical protein